MVAIPNSIKRIRKRAINARSNSFSTKHDFSYHYCS
jgi:hypothetical protein